MGFIVALATRAEVPSCRIGQQATPARPATLYDFGVLPGTPKAFFLVVHERNILLLIPSLQSRPPFLRFAPYLSARVAIDGYDP